jgi:hypothetical protein
MAKALVKGSKQCFKAYLESGAVSKEKARRHDPKVHGWSV